MGRRLLRRRELDRPGRGSGALEQKKGGRAASDSLAQPRCSRLDQPGLIFTDRLAIASVAQTLVGQQVDRIGDELNRRVAQTGVHATGVFGA